MAEQDLNIITSEILTTGVQPRRATNTANSVLIIGTAIRGPVGIPIAVEEDEIEDIFGEVRNDSSFEKSIVKGYREIKAAAQTPIDIAVMRTGDTSNANITLYETQNFASGDLSYTLPAETSIFIEALSDGEAYNGITVTVEDDVVSGVTVPTLMTIEVADEIAALSDVGVTKRELQLDPLYTSQYGLKNTFEVVSAINNDPFLSQFMRAYTYGIPKTYELEITDDGTGNPTRLYDIGPAEGTLNASWGDKLVRIDSIVEYKEVTSTIRAGLVQSTLDYLPNKDNEALTATISRFIRVVENEVLVRGSASNLGGNTAYFKCTLFASIWDNSDSTYNLFDYKLKKKTGTNTWATLTETTDYTVDKTTGLVTFTTNAFPAGFAIGDEVVAEQYKYKVNYVEANLREQLEHGKAHSYFIYGQDIIFGLAQPTKLEVVYTSKYLYKPGEVSIGDPNIAEPDRTTLGFRDFVLYFNGPELPTIGNTVAIEFQHMPELPAATGSTIQLDEAGTEFTVQSGSFSGGKSGTYLSNSDFKEYLRDALQKSENYPFRYIIVQGIYLDDAMSGYNFNTGLPETQPANFHQILIDAVNTKSRTVSECTTIIPTRPPRGIDLSPEVERNWVDRHLYIDDDDPIRPANIMAGINSYRCSVVMGTPIVSLSTVSATRYVANPANIYVAMKYDQEFRNNQDDVVPEAMIRKELPQVVGSLAIQLANNVDIGNLNALRYTSFVYNVKTGRPVIADAPTLATDPSLQRQFVVDTVLMVVQAARDAADPFIGKAKMPEVLQSLRRAIGAACKRYVNSGRLLNFSVEILENPETVIRGNLKVKLSLTTAVEIRSIAFLTQLKLA